MPPSWISLAALSAVFLGFYDVAKKVAVNKHHPLLVLLHGSVSGLLLLMVPWCASVGGLLTADSSFFVRPMEPKEHAHILLKAIIVSSSWVCSYLAIRHLPLSLAVPIRASAPLFTVLGAVLLLAERLDPIHWVAITSIFVGYVGLARLGRKEGIEWTRSPAVFLLVAATLLGALSGLYDKHLLGHLALPATTVQFWFCVYNVGLQSLVVAEFLRRDKVVLGDCFSPSWLSVSVGLSLVLADQLYFRALNQEGALIAVVSMTRRSNVIISFVVGGLLLREVLLWQKAKMLVFVVSGVVLLFL